MINFEHNQDLDEMKVNNDDGVIEFEEDEEAKKQRKCSLVYEYIIKNKAVFISLDLEHGGENYGITQLSAQLFALPQHLNCEQTTEINHLAFLTFGPDLTLS